MGSSFLQELVQQTGNTGDIGQLATVMNIELAAVIVVFGPIILLRFLRSLANHARRAWAKAPPQRLQPKQGLKRKLAPSEWASPERIGGEHWRN